MYVFCCLFVCFCIMGSRCCMRGCCKITELSLVMMPHCIYLYVYTAQPSIFITVTCMCACFCQSCFQKEREESRVERWEHNYEELPKQPCYNSYMFMLCPAWCVAAAGGYNFYMCKTNSHWMLSIIYSSITRCGLCFLYYIPCMYNYPFLPFHL